jgi:uncharacterized damage-inducible protein DinB
MNPYAEYVDGLDPMDVLQSTPSELQSLIAGMSVEAMDAPLEPGKWSLREVLAHLADCELVWGWRTRQVLESPGCTLTPFDQDAWAKHYRAYSAADALRTFLALRAWNLALLTTVSAEERSYPVYHPERGALTMNDQLVTFAGHDRHHLLALRRQLGR